MKKFKLYIATSIDGYIAREDGSLDWLENLPNPDQTDYDYKKFYDTIDVVVMGRKTYEIILGFDVDWPYGDSTTYIITSRKAYQPETENTKVLNRLDSRMLSQIRSSAKKNIWVVGGGKLITSLLNTGVVEEMVLCVIPIILGSGIPLFPDKPKETNFSLIKSNSYKSGAVLNYYKIRTA